MRYEYFTPVGPAIAHMPSQEASAMTTGLAVLEDYRCLEVRVLTDITVRNAASIREGILSAWEERGRPGPLILDLAGVRHIDSAAVGALLAVSNHVEDAGISLFIRGLQKSPRRLLERTVLSGLFQVAGERASASTA
jgi:anti-anti-sigma factor